jgi:hypothetical protein
MQTNALILFLQEIFSRLKTKSPTFFKVWQTIAGIVTAVTGLPGFLAMFNIVLPPALTILENKIVGAAAAGVLFMSLMPTQAPAAAISTDGCLLKTTDDKKLPFTAKAEAKAENKKETAVGGTSLPVVDIKK